MKSQFLGNKSRYTSTHTAGSVEVNWRYGADDSRAGSFEAMVT